MIHAGTISTGSGRTVAVAGAYWISSISRLRKTTLPGVTATSRPTSKRSAPTGRLPPSARSQSSTKLPRAAHAGCAPPSRSVRSSTSGIGRGEVRRREHVEELARAERDHVLVLLRDAAHAGRRVVPPLLRQQERLVDRRRTAACCHASATKRRSCGSGSMQGSMPSTLQRAAHRVVGEPQRTSWRPSRRAAAACPARTRDATPSPSRRRSAPSATGPRVKRAIAACSERSMRLGERRRRVRIAQERRIRRRHARRLLRLRRRRSLAARGRRPARHVRPARMSIVAALVRSLRDARRLRMRAAVLRRAINSQHPLAFRHIVGHRVAAHSAPAPRALRPASRSGPVGQRRHVLARAGVEERGGLAPASAARRRATRDRPFRHTRTAGPGMPLIAWSRSALQRCLRCFM